MVLIIGSGFLAGSIHVLTGPDHLAALLPLSVGKRWRAWVIGARWGFGHSSGVIVIALLAVALRERFDLEAVGAWGERLVGIMLIAIGGLGIRRAIRMHLHTHAHTHEGQAHAHLHVHASDAHLADQATFHVHQHTAFFAGTLHGVAGTSHFLGVLPAVALASWLNSGVYLIGFAVGTIAAMGGFAAAIGEASSRVGQGSMALPRRLVWTSSSLAILVGIAWILVPLMGYEFP